MTDDIRTILTAIARIDTKIEALTDRINWIADTINDHECRIRDLEEDNTKDHEKRLRTLENWKSVLVGKIAATMLIFGTIISVATAWLMQ